ncbi:hypothetical protein I4U23_021580 [Adineta vaga]|nr:hypothetical protein I4U23_021580 [Adineta vaga]
MCRSYGDQYEILLKDKRDISSYLKKQLELRNEQVFDLNDRLIGLQKAKDQEKDFYEKTFQDFKEKTQKEIEKLENDNLLLKTRLIALDEFKYQRQTMETRIEELENLIQQKEDAYRFALDQIEIALILFKNRLKKEAIQYLNDLAIEFHRTTKHQLSQTIQRTIHENFYLNNQIKNLSTQLEKSFETNRKTEENNQQLTRTIAILQDIETQSANQIFTTENIIRMLCKQLKECKEEKVMKTKIIELKTTNENKPDELKPESICKKNEEESIELKSFKEENYLLKNIIDRAAIAINNVIQSEDNPNEMLKNEKRSEMLEEFLSILLTSHHLGRIELSFQNQSSLTKGIFPATRLDLHRIRTDHRTKSTSHYHLGDLGIVPSN